MKDLADWLLRHEGFYEGYWFWVSLAGFIVCILYCLDAWANIREGKSRNGSMIPVVIQAEGQLFAGLLGVIGFGISSLIGLWAITDSPNRRYLIIGLLVLITSMMGAYLITWTARKIALYRVRRSIS